MKVLIVDDSKIVCEGLQRMLINVAGVEIVGQAHNAKGALRSISNLKPDIVTLDIRLHNSNGIEVLKGIRDKKLPIKVIVLTNYPYPQYREKCMELGADFFFDKVKEIEKIPSVIEEFVKAKLGNMKHKQ